MSRAPYIRWTPIMDEYLKVQRKRGESFATIARAMGISDRSARNRYRVLFLNVLDPDYMPRRIIHNLETRLAVVEMRQRKVPLKVVALKLGLRVNQVHGIWNHWRDYVSVRKAA